MIGFRPQRAIDVFRPRCTNHTLVHVFRRLEAPVSMSAPIPIDDVWLQCDLPAHLDGAHRCRLPEAAGSDAGKVYEWPFDEGSPRGPVGP